MEELVPDLDPSAAAAGLESALGDWPAEAEGRAAIRPVVGPPGTGISSTLALLAERRGWPLLEPPPIAELLKVTAPGDQALGAVTEDSEIPLVISRLESFYLRHESGFDWIRGLLHRGGPGHRPLLIGCDSWAWAFLDRALGIHRWLGEPLVPASLDGPRLASLLGAEAGEAGYEVRPTAGGDDLFAASTGEHAAPLLVDLASVARGNAGVVFDIWRRAVRQRAAGAEPEVELPALPEAVAQAHRFVLHALLLHGGVARETLSVLLPFPRDQILRGLEELRAPGVLEKRGEAWRVTPAAYPGVRRHLASAGFLVDRF